MKQTFFTLLLSVFAFSAFAQLNVTYKGNLQYDEGVSDIWGYAAPDDSEYALVGGIGGVSIVDLADPENPVELFYVNGVNSGWRDIKTWGEYAYVTNESSNGVMVIDLTDLPNSISSFDWTPNIPNVGTLNSCHNIYIDEFGYAYLAGCNINGGGFIYVDVFTNPGTPVYAGKGAAVYSHDVFVQNNRAYGSEIYAGSFAIYDVTDKSNTLFLGSQATFNNFAHNSWASEDGNILYTTDEVSGGTVGAYDVSDPSDIQVLDNFQPYETLGDGVIPHNVHVWEDWLIVSYYSDGCILVDGSRPENLVEVGNFDTFIPTTTGFSGAWGAYPYLPSGLILISDRESGLYVLEPTYVNACWLEGEITDASNGADINGASVELLTTNVFETSQPNGEYKTGFAVPGTYDVLVKKAGYDPETVQAVLENGVVTILDVALTPLVPFAVSGLVIDEDTNQPVPNAKISIANDDFSYDSETDANGNFNISTFLGGDYDVFAGKWGYKTTGISSQSIDENNNTLTIEISEGYEDIFSVDLGWTVNVDTITGLWERGKPIGILVGPNFYLTPSTDVNQDIGSDCFVTGNETDLFGGLLLAGSTILTSPVFDLSDYQEPYLSYYTAYLNLIIPQGGGNPVPGDQDLLVKLSNGLETVYIDTITYPQLTTISWQYSEKNILDYITPTENMTISFEAFAPMDSTQATEAGVDYFKVWDASPLSAKDLIDNRIKLLAYPNPSSQNFVIKYELENFSSDSKLMVYNTLGQIVVMENLNDRNGQIEIGNDLEKGIYFAHITNGNSISKSLKLIKQ